MSFVVLFFISQKGREGNGNTTNRAYRKRAKTAFGQEIDKKNIRSSKRAKERFSRREIEDLMGCNRAIYVKRGGTIRQR